MLAGVVPLLHYTGAFEVHRECGLESSIVCL